MYLFQKPINASIHSVFSFLAIVWVRFLVVHMGIVLGLFFALQGLPARSESIYLSQNFNLGAADLFEQALTDDIDTVVLSSSGGYLTEGMAIGRIIRAHNLNTFVPTGAACLSACAEAFIGGVSLQINGTVAFHLPYVDQKQSQRQAFDAGFSGGTMTAIYRFEMGFGFELTQTINRWTTSERLLAFNTADELLRYKNPESGVKLPRFYRN